MPSMESTDGPNRPADRVGAFLRERTPRRFVSLAVFIGLLILFRQLLLLLVFFVAFERSLTFTSGWLARRARVGHKAALLIMTFLFLTALVLGAVFGVEKLVRFVYHMRDTLPDRIAQVRESPLFQRAQEYLPDTDKLVTGAQEWAKSLLHYLAAIGHILLFATIGFILAVVFLLEHEEISKFATGLDPHSLQGTLLRWFGHVADAMVVTIEFQMVVAACNAVLTFPILLLCGIKHAPSLALMIFASGLVPVVGNFVAGAILTLLAWHAQGWFGVGLFTALTFILHKLESYYLNPRLAARHVHLPGFVLIVSLLAWEHVLGFAGLFLSFPFLYVAKRIRDELRTDSGYTAPP